MEAFKILSGLVKAMALSLFCMLFLMVFDLLSVGMFLIHRGFVISQDIFDPISDPEEAVDPAEKTTTWDRETSGK